MYNVLNKVILSRIGQWHVTILFPDPILNPINAPKFGRTMSKNNDNLSSKSNLSTLGDGTNMSIISSYPVGRNMNKKKIQNKYQRENGQTLPAIMVNPHTERFFDFSTNKGFIKSHPVSPKWASFREHTKAFHNFSFLNSWVPTLEL